MRMTFSSFSALQLFGEGFSKKAKERDEELQCLNKATGRQTNPRGPQRPTQFFQGGRSFQNFHRGNGHFHGGRRAGQHKKPTFPPKTQ